ncbi:amidohydrolase [Streptomyces syringium]|uniref:amidohydrolase n=1 Tax=Streptomyces syringium TaxID=76729 RepID=UPI003F544B3A
MTPSSTPSPADRVRRVLLGLDGIMLAATTLCLAVHADPELSGEEERTAARLAAWLTADGFRVTPGVGGHGVVGVLRNGEGPRVLVRAELDALPVAERTGLPYASTVRAPGPDGRGVPVMHACGHDLHLAAAAGAARLLARATHLWRGTLVVVGQPAEETLQGARAMLEDGLYDRFGRPDAVLAQHTAPFPAGMVAHGTGALMAGSLSFDVVVHGRGGHAATPHLTVNPVATAAAAVGALHALVATETDPADRAVLTVCRLHTGDSRNVVPDRATLGLTVRAHSQAALDSLAEAVRRTVHAECAASGRVDPPEITLVSRSAPNVPDPSATAAVREAHQALLGTGRVALWPPSMAAEDFPLFGDAGRGIHGFAGIPTVYWMLGSVGARQWRAAPGRTPADKLAALPPNHSPEFAPDVRSALPTGISAMVAAALDRLGSR